MPKYKVTYWPGSGLASPALTGDEIKRNFPEKTYEIEAANFEQAQRITIHGKAGKSSDGCLIEEIPAN